ncbi:unnamed protein product [Protopolystoma xenopodis]|uniref:Uncharacterized protein n=1 Tax=Protopolystoma xenopodis TaxID=117903 RepID=A0A3S5BDJ7_9PLAT|nr:unnamed protein product [Protopolystoma xenopodis]
MFWLGGRLGATATATTAATNRGIGEDDSRPFCLKQSGLNQHSVQPRCDPFSFWQKRRFHNRVPTRPELAELRIGTTNRL